MIRLNGGDHDIGKTVTVCGPVAGASYFEHLRGAPTFLNFDRRHPDQSFTVVLWGVNARSIEHPPHRMYGVGKEICVTGRIATYKGKPQIVVRDPAQITAVEPVFEGERSPRTLRALAVASMILSARGNDSSRLNVAASRASLESKSTTVPCCIRATA